ncbi:MAG TPA: acyl-CoA dehydrogenase family protein [Candidatus Limnocylindrales bacterium]|nr:acyl-CoA dehydrogenase family protein [Candidatus Limnocylindrales bacterium]
MIDGPGPTDAARAFVAGVVRPGLEAWDQAARFPRSEVADSGLTGLFSPQDVGGLDLWFPDGMGVFEELGRGDAALAFALSMHNAVASAVARAAGPDLRDRWAARLATGHALGGFSLTEPQAGSDAAAITTRGVESADGWRLTGRKAWVSLAAEADLFLVVAKTADEPGHRDVAMFALDRRAPGVSFPIIYRKAAAHFLPIGEMELLDAPAELLVAAGSGMRAALGAIDIARCDIAAISNGLHAEALDVALGYAHGRRVFGGSLLDQQGIGWMLADIATDLEAGRHLTRRAAELLGTPDGAVAVAHAKRFGPDAALRAAITASEVLGAYGWLVDHPLARMIAEAKMLTVVDGTAEICRVVIARDLVRRAAAL